MPQQSKYPYDGQVLLDLLEKMMNGDPYYRHESGGAVVAIAGDPTRAATGDKEKPNRNHNKLSVEDVQWLKNHVTQFTPYEGSGGRFVGKGSAGSVDIIVTLLQSLDYNKGLSDEAKAQSLTTSLKALVFGGAIYNNNSRGLRETIREDVQQDAALLMDRVGGDFSRFLDESGLWYKSGPQSGYQLKQFLTPGDADALLEAAKLATPSPLVDKVTEILTPLRSEKILQKLHDEGRSIGDTNALYNEATLGIFGQSHPKEKLLMPKRGGDDAEQNAALEVKLPLNVPNMKPQGRNQIQI